MISYEILALVANPSINIWGPPLVVGEDLASYLVEFGQILNASPDNLNGRWSFNIMLDRKAFVPIPNYLDVEVRKLRSFCPAVNQHVGSVERLVPSPLPTKKSVDPIHWKCFTHRLCGWGEGNWGIDRTIGSAIYLDLRIKAQAVLSLYEFQGRFPGHIYWTNKKRTIEVRTKFRKGRKITTEESLNEPFFLDTLTPNVKQHTMAPPPVAK